ncbi:hypothetical protein [Curtobacterium sp. B8]|uniref:hypothetical protein n=1 Tax=Curtobacterium sp. B8 TaxID=95611 RepID=UPI00034DAB7D|nr:hypothetical protein [Curtobacterium sp. B8]
MQEARHLVESRLHDGEELLWVGRSDPGRMFVHADRFLIPFGALWTGFVATGLVGAAIGSAHPAVLVALSALLLLGLHVLGGRFLVKRHRKRTDVYAVTDRRVLVTNGRTTRETDARRTDWYVDRTEGHVTVEWDDISHLDTLFLNGSESVRQYANTGLDLTPGRGNFALYDVADADALLAALRTTSGR